MFCCAELGQSSGGAEGRHWVLDPIDGTRGFVGMRQYAVCLGMLQDGEVVLGVLGCPNLPQAAVADDDGGAGKGLSRFCGFKYDAIERLMVSIHRALGCNHVQVAATAVGTC